MLIDNSAYAQAALSEYECDENEYIDEGFGISYPIIVKVKYENGVIENVDVLYNMETPGIGTKALNNLPDLIVEMNSADYETLKDLDAVSGATITTFGICQAVQDAISKAE